MGQLHRCNQLNYREFLEQALAEEWGARHQKGLEARLTMARLPWIKTLEQFDFGFQPTIDQKVIRELPGLGFVNRNENVILLRPPGVGKTHIAVSLAVKAAESGHRELFMTLDRLMSTLIKARQENGLARQLQQLTYPKVLVLDGIGYLPMTREEASLFSRHVNRRYERASTILPSNKSFMDWGEVLGDQVIATPILDRLLHHSTTLNIKGTSHRLKDRRRSGLMRSTSPKRRKTPTLSDENRTPLCIDNRTTFAGEKRLKNSGVETKTLIPANELWNNYFSGSLNTTNATKKITAKKLIK